MQLSWRSVVGHTANVDPLNDLLIIHHGLCALPICQLGTWERRADVLFSHGIGMGMFPSPVLTCFFSSPSIALYSACLSPLTCITTHVHTNRLPSCIYISICFFFINKHKLSNDR